MVTSVQISEELQKELVRRKMFDKETYEEVIWNLVEDSLELSDQTKKELAQARSEIKSGKSHTLAAAKEKLGP